MVPSELAMPAWLIFIYFSYLAGGASSRATGDVADVLLFTVHEMDRSRFLEVDIGKL